MKTKIKFHLLIVLTIITSASINAQVITQSVKGRVIDKHSETPLFCANIIVVDSDPFLGATTDFDGYFKIENIPLGRHDLKITFIGYKPLIIPNIQVNSGKEVVLEIVLEESAKQMKQVVIKDKNIRSETVNSMAGVSARTFSVEEARRYAGGFDDPARLASSFAGVATGDAQDNSIIIRGNSPKGLLWQVEGVAVPNPNHFAGGNVAGGGIVTVFSSQLLSNSDFFTGAFPAEYGNALSGVFDMHFRNGNSDKQEFTFQAGVLGIDLAAEGPFKKGSRASYLINYRYSTFSIIKNLIPGQQVPKYQDLSFKINVPTKKAGTFSLWGFGALDFNDEPVDYDSTLWESDWDRIEYVWNLNFGALGLTHKMLIGNSAYSKTTVAATGTSSIFDTKRVDDNLILKNDDFSSSLSGKYIIHSYFSRKFSSKHTNRTGFIFNNLFYDMKMERYINDLPITLVNEKGSSNLFQMYSQSKFNFNDNIILNTGVHAQYFALTERFSVEPRINLKWNMSENHSISLGYGLHSQIEELNVYLYQYKDQGETIMPNEKLDFTKSHHIVLGYNWILNKNMRLRVEPYYQYLFNVPVVEGETYSMLNTESMWGFDKSLLSVGNGKNIGIDFTLERFLNDGYYFLFTTSVFSSKYSDNDGNWHSTRFNKNYVINLLTGKEFVFDKANKNKVLGINTKISFAGGHRMAPVDRDLSLQMRDIYYDWSKPYTYQENPNLFADLTVTWRTNRPKFSSEWGFMVKNVLCSSIEDDYYYNLQTNDISKTKLVIVIPSISYKIEF
jgi:CarboxypepD_reg-like domain